MLSQTKTQVDSLKIYITDKNTDRWTNKQKTYRKTAKVWTTRQSAIWTDRLKMPANRRQADKITDRQTNKQANKNSYRVIDKWTY